MSFFPLRGSAQPLSGFLDFSARIDTDALVLTLLSVLSFCLKSPQQEQNSWLTRLLLLHLSRALAGLLWTRRPTPRLCFQVTVKERCLYFSFSRSRVLQKTNRIDSLFLCIRRASKLQQVEWADGGRRRFKPNRRTGGVENCSSALVASLDEFFFIKLKIKQQSCSLLRLPKLYVQEIKYKINLLKIE